MGHVVGEVTGYKAGAERRRVVGADHEVERGDDDHADRNAHRGGHDEAHRVVWVVVVDAVDDPVKACADPILGLEVKDDPVQPVLEERPRQVAADEEAGEDEHGEMLKGEDREHNDRRREDDHRHRRMHAREEVEQAGVEHPRRRAQRVCARGR